MLTLFFSPVNLSDNETSMRCELYENFNYPGDDDNVISQVNYFCIDCSPILIREHSPETFLTNICLDSNCNCNFDYLT